MSCLMSVHFFDDKKGRKCLTSGLKCSVVETDTGESHKTKGHPDICKETPEGSHQIDISSITILCDILETVEDFEASSFCVAYAEIPILLDQGSDYT